MDEAGQMLAVQPIIVTLADRLCRRVTSLDRDEVVDSAQAAALISLRSHKEGQTTLTTWVYLCVRRFYSAQVRYAEWRRRHSKKAVYPARELPKRNDFDLELFLLDLSQEAQEVVHKALTGNGSYNSLIQELYGLEWEAGEIKKVFREIRAALWD